MNLQLGSTGLNVTELDQSVAFYEKTLGLQEIRRSQDPQRRWAHLGVREVVLLTLWQQATVRFDAGRAGLHHVSFEVETLGALTDLEGHLRSLAIPVRGDRGEPGQLSRTGQLFFVDPDGIRVEVFTDDSAASDDSHLPQPSCGFYEEAAASGS